MGHGCRPPSRVVPPSPPAGVLCTPSFLCRLQPTNLEPFCVPLIPSQRGQKHTLEWGVEPFLKQPNLYTSDRTRSKERCQEVLHRSENVTYLNKYFFTDVHTSQSGKYASRQVIQCLKPPPVASDKGRGCELQQ